METVNKINQNKNNNDILITDANEFLVKNENKI